MTGLDEELEWQAKRLFGPNAGRTWALVLVGLLGLAPIGALAYCAACVMGAG